MLPVIMTALSHDGIQGRAEISTPKKVCITMPTTNVPAPRVVTKGARFFMLSTFLNSIPPMMSSRPYPASPMHMAKKSRKKTEM